MTIQWEIGSAEIEWDFRGEPQFEVELALAHLLINDVVFLNSSWWEKDWPKEAQESTTLFVNCNDVFAWGCADGESLPYTEIENLYRMWQKDPEWGPAIWCMMQRKEMPQKPLEDIIREKGVWDLDSLGLEPNTTQEYLTQELVRVAREIKENK